MKRAFVWVVLLLLCGVTFAFGQGVAVPEKVYVHLDRTCYAAGETMWLAGYVENALPEADTSRFLYVELTGPDGGEALVRTKIKRGRRGFEGHLDIPDSLASGDYLLRAYTRWQLNWPEDRLFRIPLRIFGAVGSIDASPSSDEIDISFYPEGGRYFAGEAASVGFKVMNAQGRGVALSGKVVDDLGTEITTARVLHAGMGLLSFTPVEGRRYRFVPDGEGKPWALPDPAADGATLQVRRIGAQWLVKVVNHTGSSCVLWLCAGGQNVAIGEVSGSDRTFRVNKGDLVEGLQKFRLTDASGNILSERAVFCESERTETISLTVNHAGESYAPRTLQKTRLRLPAGVDSATVSVSIVRHTFQSYVQETGIASYMLLGSELRGYIENPDYYFSPSVPEKDRRASLDLLILIQGWSYYDFVPAYPLARETTQSLRGEVRGLSKRSPRNYLLSVMAPSLNYSQIEKVAEGGRFMIDSLDFRDSTVFILQATREGALQKYAPTLLPDPIAAVPGPWGASWPFFDPRLVDSGREAGPIDSPFPEGIFLRDSITTATIQADYVRIKSPFGSTPRMGAKTREDLEPYEYMDVLSYVLAQKPTFSKIEGGQITVRDSRSYEYFGDIALCVNGIRMDWDIGETIYLSDVEKISISTRDSDSFLLHADGVVLVELRTPQSKPLTSHGNTTVLAPLGWQSPRYFYHPRYDKPRVWVPDQRNTIYWNPSLGLRGGVNNTIFFYTDDQNDGPYFLRLEGRTPDGRWVSASACL